MALADILIVLNTNCGVGDKLHHCTQPSISNIRFYDIGGRNARTPKLLNEFKVDTHEFFLWQDPKVRDRALIFAGNAAATGRDPRRRAQLSLSVWDISACRTARPGNAVHRPARLHAGDDPVGEPVEKPTGRAAFADRHQRRPADLLRPAHRRLRWSSTRRIFAKGETTPGPTR